MGFFPNQADFSALLEILSLRSGLSISHNRRGAVGRFQIIGNQWQKARQENAPAAHVGTLLDQLEAAYADAVGDYETLREDGQCVPEAPSLAARLAKIQGHEEVPGATPSEVSEVQAGAAPANDTQAPDAEALTDGASRSAAEVINDLLLEPNSLPTSPNAATASAPDDNDPSSWNRDDDCEGVLAVDDAELLDNRGLDDADGDADTVMLEHETQQPTVAFVTPASVPIAPDATGAPPLERRDPRSRGPFHDRVDAGNETCPEISDGTGGCASSRSTATVQPKCVTNTAAEKLFDRALDGLESVMNQFNDPTLKGAPRTRFLAMVGPRLAEAAADANYALAKLGVGLPPPLAPITPAEALLRISAALANHRAPALADPHLAKLINRVRAIADHLLARLLAVQSDLRVAQPTLTSASGIDGITAAPHRVAQQLTEAAPEFKCRIDSGGGTWAPTGSVRQHPKNAQLFGNVNDDERTLLRDNVAKYGINRLLIVTGTGCASPPGTIVCGNRRHLAALDAGLPEVPVVVRDNLGANDEECIMIGANLGDQLGRKLKPSALAGLEKRLAELVHLRRGARTDLVPAVTSDRGCGLAKGETTWGNVARQTESSRTTALARNKVFFAPTSTPALKAAVDAGKFGVNEAANLVRAVEKEHGAIDDKKAKRGTVPNERALQRLHEKVDDRLREASTKQGKGERHGSRDLVHETITIPLKASPDGMHGAAIMRGRRITVLLRQQEVVITLGAKAKSSATGSNA